MGTKKGASEMKNKKIPAFLFFLLIFVFLTFLLFFGSERTQGKVWYVDDDGGAHADFTKIQDAVSNATEGDIIRVYEGLYSEHILVNKPLTIIGNGSENTTIKGGEEKEVVNITANWVNFSGFCVKGFKYTSTGIVVWATNARLSNNTVTTTLTAIFLKGIAHVVVEENNITKNIDGITAEETNFSIIKNNLCINNTGKGIYLIKSNNCTVLNNSLLNTGTGISLSGSEDNTIEKNLCVSNINGISLWYSDRNRLLQNNCSFNGGGMVLFASDRCLIENNTFFKNLCGIYLYSSLAAKVSGCTFEEDGLLISGDSPDFWTTHHISNTNLVNGKVLLYLKNATGGVVPADVGEVILANCSGIELKNLNISHTYVSLLLGYSSNLTISNGSFLYQKRYSVSLHSSSDIFIKNSIIFKSNEYGVYISSSANITVENTVFRENYCSLYIKDSDNVSVLKSIFSQCESKGIQLISSYSVLLFNNTISANKVGIYIKENSEGVRAHNNSIFANLKYGIDASENGGEDYLVDACYNWWGDVSGPYHPEFNPEGKGDKVTDGVDFDPWTGKKDGGEENQAQGQLLAVIDLISPNPAFEGELVVFKGHGISSFEIVCFVWYSSLDGLLYNGSEPTFFSSNLSAGEHLISFRVKEESGVWSEWVKENLTVLKLPAINKKPFVKIISPQDGALVSAVVNITGMAWDQDGNVTSVELSINGSRWLQAEGREEWYFLWNTTEYENKSYLIFVRCFDGEDYSDVMVLNLTVMNEAENGSEEDSNEKEEPKPEDSFSFNVLILVSLCALLLSVMFYLRRQKKKKKGL